MSGKNFLRFLVYIIASEETFVNNLFSSLTEYVLSKMSAFINKDLYELQHIISPEETLHNLIVSLKVKGSEREYPTTVK